jgi:hypothetical protein
MVDLAQQVDFADVAPIFANNQKMAFSLMQTINILPDTRICDDCNNTCKPVWRTESRVQHPERAQESPRWQCQTRNCRREYSVRTNTMLGRSGKLHMADYVKLFYCFAEELPPATTIKMTKLGAATVTQW